MVRSRRFYSCGLSSVLGLGTETHKSGGLAKKGKNKNTVNNSLVSSEAGRVPTKSQLSASGAVGFTSSCAPVAVYAACTECQTRRDQSARRGFSISPPGYCPQQQEQHSAWELARM